MASYGTTNESFVTKQEETNSPPTTWQKITHNRWVNLALLLMYVFVICVVIACVVIISVYHKHLILQCGYAEFIALLGVVSLVVIFSLYHLVGIFKFFKRRAQRSSKKGFAAVFDPVLYTDLGDEHFSKEVQEEQDENEYDDDDDDDEEDEVEEESKATKVAIIIGKILITLLAILGFIGLVVFTSVAVPLQQMTLAQWNGRLLLNNFQHKGKNAPVIYRESNGVVHIEADNDYDLFFSQGVAIAQDRMWQLEYNKRFAAGTLSAITGRTSLNQDKLARTLNLRARAVADLANFDQTTLNNIQAYVDGINAFYNTNPTLAPEFYYLKVKEPSNWEPADVVAVSKLFAWDLSTNGRLELLRYNLLQQGITQKRVDELIPRYDVNRFSTVLSTEDLNITLSKEEIDILEAKQQDDSGFFQPAVVNTTLDILTSDLYNHFGRINSNNWVVSGNFTKNKKPILANDPHLKLTAPGQFHLIHLKNNADINAIGASIVGVPGVFIGRNDKISWGVTNAELDGQDFFALEEVVKDVSYKHNGKVVEYKIRDETIEIAGESSISIKVKESDIYGPIMNDVWSLPNAPLSMAWTSLRNDTSVVTYLSTFRASTWTTFVQSLKSAVAGFAYTFADANGNIGYAVSGKVPVRKQGHTGRYVVKGDGSWDYLSYLDSSQLPAVLNPTKGYIISANNRITPPGYQYVLTQDYNGLYRAERIHERVYNSTDIDVGKTQDVQKDIYSALFADLKSLIAQMKNNVSDDFKPWVDKVIKWNANEELYSQEASVFEMWFSQLGEIVKDEIGRRWNNALFIRHALMYGDAACDKQNATCIELAAKQFDNAVSTLEGTYGSIPLWGSDIHESEFTNNLLGNTLLKCLAGKIVVTVGGTHTVNEGSVDYPTLSSTYGVSYRQIVDMSGVEKDQFIIPLGQSGNFLSSGYDDLLGAWKNGDYLQMNRDGYQGGSKLVIASS
jgi:penicillin amidase